MGGDTYFDKDLGRSQATGVGTNSGQTTTIAACNAGNRWNVTGIQVSGDAAALVTIESPASTILWSKRFAGSFAASEGFPLGQMKGGVAAAVLVKISASTSNCEANIQAIQIPD